MKKVLILSLAAFLLPASGLAAQTCVGIPILPGQFGLGGVFEIDSDGRRYGGRVDGNFHPFALGATYLIDDLDAFEDTGWTVGGRAAVELPIPTSAICPILEVNYSTIPAGFLPDLPSDAEFRTLRIPLLLGVGQRFDLPDGTYVVPSARGGFQHTRSWADIQGQDTDTVTDNHIIVAGSLALGRGITFLSAGFFLSNEEAIPPRFQLGVGLALP